MSFGHSKESKNEHRDKKDVIDWVNPRLISSVRLLIYFSEIFPKKYLHLFESKINDNDIAAPSKRTMS